MKISKHPAGENRLLATLPAGKRRLFLEDCEHVQLGFAEVLCEPGELIRHVYFPTESFISLLAILDDGARLEVGIVGDEGMLGTALVLGTAISPQHAVVQGAGAALRMSAQTFGGHVERSPSLRLELYRYIHVLMSQLAQTAACTHFHLVETRLARWLLLTRDRAHSDQFRLTHEFLAYMLGVRRIGITDAANALRERGLIGYSRGKIAVLDIAGLRKASCGCYQQANDIYEQTMSLARNSSLRH